MIYDYKYARYMMHSCWERFKHAWNLRIAHVYCTFDEWRGFIAFRSF